MKSTNNRKRAHRTAESLSAPLLGLAWVLLNLVVEWLGFLLGHETAFSMGVGGLDGMVISVIVVAKLSQKFQACMTGLLGGFSLDSLLGSGSSAVARVTESIHAILDGMQLLPGPEQVHQQLQAAVIQGIWTAVVVVVAALLVKWAQDASVVSEGHRLAVGHGVGSERWS